MREERHWSCALLYPLIDRELSAWMAAQVDPFLALRRLRLEWLLHLLFHAGADRATLLCVVCACVRSALGGLPPGEKRPGRVIEATEAWARRQGAAAEVAAAAAETKAYMESCDEGVARIVCNAVINTAEGLQGRWPRVLHAPALAAQAVGLAHADGVSVRLWEKDISARAVPESHCQLNLPTLSCLATDRESARMVEQIYHHRWPVRGRAQQSVGCRPALAVMWDRLYEIRAFEDLSTQAVLATPICVEALSRLVAKPNNAERIVIRTLAEHIAMSADPHDRLAAAQHVLNSAARHTNV